MLLKYFFLVVVILSAAKNPLVKQATQKGLANAYGNAGTGYRVKADYTQALENYFAALKIDEALNNKPGIARRLGSIGNVYMYQTDYPKALDYYLKALRIAEELGNKQLQAANLGNIGNVYKEKARSEKSKVKSDSLHNKAPDYFFKALRIAEELGIKTLVI